MGEYRTTSGEPPPTPLYARRRRLRRALLLSAVGVAVAVAAGTAIRIDREVPATGYVTTRLYAEVRPSVVGPVAEIRAKSGDAVAEGDLLLRLDDAEDRAALDEAGDRVREAAADSARRRAEIAEARREWETQLAVAELRLRHATAKLDLNRELREKGLTSGLTLKDVELAEQLARAERDAIQAQDLTIAEKEIAVREQDLAARRDLAARLEARLLQRDVRAPISGRVVRYEFSVGEIVRPETVLYEIFGGDPPILKIRIPERHAALVAAGQSYRARLTSYRRWPRIWFRGVIENPRDVIQVENRITYRVATCSFEPRDYAVPPGTTADVRVRVGRGSFWSYLFGVY